MLSRTKALYQGAVNYIKQLRISVKLTLIYAALIAILLFATSSFTVIALYYTQYHQAEKEMNISIVTTLRQLEETCSFQVEAPSIERWHRGDMPRAGRHPIPHDEMDHTILAVKDKHGHVTIQEHPVNEEFNPANIVRLDVFPGVFLKITDGSGGIVFDSDEHSPSLAVLASHIQEHIPVWANPKFQIIRLENFIIYYRDVPILLNGQAYTLHFFKTITAETHMLEMIQEMLLGEMIAGLLLALIIGYFLSQKLLKPIRTMTDTAQAIEVSDLGRRIYVSPAQDELSKLAETFNTMLQRIQEGFIQQQHFVSDASHELRTPITVIKGYADMLNRWGKEDPETLEESLKAISSEAEDMQELIEKLLFLARADQKRQIINKQPLDLQALIHDVYKKLELTVQDHETELLHNDAGMIFADKVVMKQMLRIFLDNAMKYTPKGGKITLSSVRMTNYMKVDIQDTGLGIAPENQEKVFQRFFRVNSSRTKTAGEVGGTGLGLSIARWIADSHDIGITLDSELGKGTCFTLMIPLWTEKAPQ